jgi:hypothetical protein
MYIAANIHPTLPTHIIAGAFNGLGAAILWTAQGVRADNVVFPHLFNDSFLKADFFLHPNLNFFWRHALL